MPNDQRYWFPAKRYGWGWGFPRTWQGRVVLAVYVILIAVCWAKGEPPRWRWGERDDL